ncbi:dolichyl-phosphate-mannose-protein mannosyltransferase [Geobacter sp. OR-1]|uniref:ArnT family glycosyltransferase n=1 Tax=Geobacter sp. OR-1 TaxID=1266765 RepID=UPI0005432DFD|nr:glycosyltransferase family 39 protein [Geobacter sp. OR-1]GAM11409.1 dolichyl-phosphate-mannose-protein mannosyltransferase [Geobacter sp. OR-1]
MIGQMVEGSDINPDSQLHRNDLLSIAGVLLLALSLRIYTFPIARVIAADGISYVNIARSIFRGEGFAGAVHFPPMFPLLIGLVNLLVGDDELAGKLVSMFMGTVLVVPVYLLARELFSRQTALAASLLVALSPSLAKLSSEVLTQSTYLALILSALYCLWRSAESLRSGWGVAAGLLLGAAYLTRPEAIVILVASTFIVFAVPVMKRRDVRLHLKMLCIVWGAFFVLATPYILLLHNLNGSWQLSGKSSVTLADSLGWYLDRPDLKREPSFAGIGFMDVIRRYPDFLWKNSVRNIQSLWDETLPVHVWLLMLLGMAAGTARVGWLRSRLFICGACAPLLILIVFFFLGNVYTAPFLPFFLIFAAQGLVALQQQLLRIPALRAGSDLSGRISRFPVAAVTGGIIGVIMFMPHISFGKAKPYHYDDDGARYDHKLIGKMLKKNLPKRSTVMARDARLTFYADMSRVDIPQADLEEILSVARKNHARYIVADGTLLGMRPQMLPLLKPLLSSSLQGLFIVNGEGYRPVPGLRLVLLFTDPASAGVAVYELLE